MGNVVSCGVLGAQKLFFSFYTRSRCRQKPGIKINVSDEATPEEEENEERE